MASAAFAQHDPGLIAYEGFDYEVDSSIEFQNGGFGWAAAWNFRQNVLGGGAGGPIMNSAIVMPGSLSYDGLQTSGNHVHLYGDFAELQLARRLAEALPSDPGTSLYISFLGQRVGPPADPDDTVLYPEGYPWGDNLYPRGAAVRFFNNANSERLSAGMFSNRTHGNWMLYAQGLDDPTDVSWTEAVAFIVIRVDFNGDSTVSDDIYMWVNPNLEHPEDTSTADLAILGPMDGANPVHYTGLTVVSPFVGHASGNRPHAEMLLDELRIGRTWASVTPLDDSSGPVDPDPGFYVDPVLSGHYYFGAGWSLWMPDGDEDDLGFIYTALREEGGTGWVHQEDLGWLYFMPGDVAAGGVFAWSEEHGWIYAWSAITGNRYYSYTAQGFAFWVQ